MNKQKLFGLTSVAGLVLVVIITTSYIWGSSGHTGDQDTGLI